MDPAVSSEVPQGSSPKNKKIFIGAIAFLGIVIVFILITVLISGGGSGEESTESNLNPQKTNTPNRQNPGKSGASPAASPAAKENTFGNFFFSIKYPLDWNAEEFNLNGGSGVYIKPKSSKRSPYTNSLTIIVEDKSSIPSVSQREQGFAGLGYKTDFISLDNLQATRLRGTFPPIAKLATPSAVKNIMQETHIFVDEGDSSYLLVYKYAGSGINPQLESLFAQMISSFKFPAKTL